MAVCFISRYSYYVQQLSMQVLTYLQYSTSALYDSSTAVCNDIQVLGARAPIVTVVQRLCFAVLTQSLVFRLPRCTSAIQYPLQS